MSSFARPAIFFMTNFKKPVLLVADDKPDNLKVIKEILNHEQEQYILITVPNGKLLVEVALKKLPDLIITDWEMPEMNGLEATRLLKQHESTKDIPVLMYTGIMTSPQNLQMALEAGAIDFIRKPLDATELLARVQSMLHLGESYNKIKAQKEELENLNDLKNKLLSIISHDVRSPLNTLKGVLFLFENNALAQDELQQITTSVKQQVQHLNHFLENLLRWVHQQQGDVQPKFEKVVLKNLILDTIELLDSIAHNKKVTIEWQLDETLMIWADEEMIKLVVRNLLANAIKFCKEGDKITIIAQSAATHAIVSVIDTGEGIDETVLPTLFGVGHLSSKGTKDEVGTGIGLTLCKEFVEKNGGSISVSSQKGKGSHFQFLVPIYSAANYY